MSQVSDNMSVAVNTLIDKGVTSGSTALLDQYKLQLQKEVDKQREALKEGLKKQLTDYLNKKIDEGF